MSVDESMTETRFTGEPLTAERASEAIPATLVEASRSRTTSPTTRWKYHFWILSAALFVLAFAFLLDVSEQETTTSLPLIGEIPQLCTWKRLLRIDCPGCGLTRSFAALAQGEWTAAWQFNAAGWMFFAVCVYQIPFRSLQLWRLSHDRADYRHGLRTINLVVWTLLAVLIIQWIWKLAS